MTTARSKLVSFDVTTWYHCTTRCVRKAFLCGYDSTTKKNYNHRRQWIEDRIIFLSKVFCVRLGSYAIMSNHYHVVLKFNPEQAKELSNKQVAERWLKLYKGTAPARKFLANETLTDNEKKSLENSISHWRSELTSISRFMSEINQKIAIRANKEDNCKGKFWEARFNSQAILDSDALIRTMVYVDLNPVRAKISNNPEKSRYTSINRRLNSVCDTLIPFITGKVDAVAFQLRDSIPISFDDYREILKWSGANVNSKKSGSVKAPAPKGFEQNAYSPDQWFSSLRSTSEQQQTALGSEKMIKVFCEHSDRKWIWKNPDHEIF